MPIINTRRFVFPGFVWLLGLFAIKTAGQPLADRLPPDTLVYSGWSPGAAMQTTLPAKMLADERFMRPWRLLLQQALLAMPDEVDGPGKLSEHLPQLLNDAGQCEGAFALLELKRTVRDWQPQAVLVINLGARRKSFEEHFKPIHDRLKERLGDRIHMTKVENSWLWSKTTREIPEYTWGYIGDSFVFYYGTDGAKFLPTLRGEKPVKSLKNSPAFIDTMTKVPGESYLTSYIDLRQGLELGHTLLKDAPNSDWAMAGLFWDKTVFALGLDNIRGWGQKISVDDDQFITHSLLRTEGAPHGLLANLVQPAVDDAILKAVPGDAMAMLAVRLDLSQLYASIKTAATTIAGDDAKKTFDALEEEAAHRGLPVAQLLAPLGDQWVLYNAGSTGGFPLFGLTLVVDVKDPEKMHQTLAAVEKALTRVFESGIAPTARFTSYQADGVTIRYLRTAGEMSFFSTAYAVVGDKLVISLYPQIAEDAVRQIVSGTGSVIDRPAFVARRKQTEGGGPLLYLSEPEIVKQIYPIVLPLISIIRGFGGSVARDDNGPIAQEDLVPSMRRLLTYVADEAVSIRVTADGIAATRSVANPLLSPVTAVDAAPLWIAASLPTIAHSGIASERARSHANLSRIGTALSAYSREQKKFPPDLETLAKSVGLPADVMKSPVGDGTHDYKYIYFAGGPASFAENSGATIVVYDATELEQGDGCSALYADGHVEWLDHDAAITALKRAENLNKGVKP